MTCLSLNMAGEGRLKRRRPPLPKLITDEEPRYEPPVDLPDSIQFVHDGVEYLIDHRVIKIEEQELGRGAYGVVNLMTHIPSGFDFAVKRIHATDVPEQKKCLKLEVETMKRAKSPFMVGCFGAFYREAYVWIFMELMDIPLDRFYGLCFDHGLKIPETLLAKIVHSILMGLNYMKTELDIVHRDIKPSNILLNSKGEVKLCDFGISANLRESTEKTRKAGTKPYMPPEMILGSDFDWTFDIWGVGITVIEIATGNHPYDNWANEFERVDQVVNQPSPSLPDNSFSAEMCDFVRKCLKKHPADRPSYEELLNHAWLSQSGCEDSDIDFLKQIIDIENKTRQQLSRKIG